MYQSKVCCSELEVRVVSYRCRESTETILEFFPFVQHLKEFVNLVSDSVIIMDLISFF